MAILLGLDSISLRSSWTLALPFHMYPDVQHYPTRRSSPLLLLPFITFIRHLLIDSNGVESRYAAFLSVLELTVKSDAKSLYATE